MSSKLTIAKVIVQDSDNKILVLRRSSTHPRYALQPDLPGGEVERHESIEQGAARELIEEIELTLNVDSFKLLATKAATKNKDYYLLLAHIEQHPKINLSWEHSDHSWKTKQEILEANYPDNLDDFYQFFLETIKTLET